MGLNKGTNVMKHKNIQSFLDDRKPGSVDDRHYFYIIQFPACSSSRVKLGITANIYARFKYYQQHLFGSDIVIHRLIRIPRQILDRYGEKGKKLYEVFEREAKYLLRDFNTDKIKNGDGALTEWFPNKNLKAFFATFDKWVDKDFENTQIEKTIKRESINRTVKKKVNYKEESEKAYDISEKGIDRSSTKRN